MTHWQSLDLFTGTAGVPPATSTARCEDLCENSTSEGLFALRAHCGRDARGASEEIEWWYLLHRIGIVDSQSD